MLRQDSRIHINNRIFSQHILHLAHAMMESHRQSQYHPILEDGPSYLSQERLHRKEDVDPLAHPDPGQYESSNTYAPPSSDQRPMDDVGLADKDQPTRQGLAFIPQPKRLSKKWQQRLYWLVSRGCVLRLLIPVEDNPTGNSGHCAGCPL